MRTEDLIAQLSQSSAVQQLRSPTWYTAVLGTVLTVYTLSVLMMMGLRADLLVQLVQPLFLLEIGLLLLLLVCSLVAAVHTLYPGMHQRGYLLVLPYVVFGLIGLLGAVQLLSAAPFEATATGFAMAHAAECAICVLLTSFVPATLLFVFLKRGASTHAHHAGFLAVLCATAIGCLVLRFNEVSVSVAHVWYAHYLPTFLYACLGVFVGRLLLRW